MTTTDKWAEFKKGIEPELDAKRKAGWTTVTGYTARALNNPRLLPTGPRRKRKAKR